MKAPSLLSNEQSNQAALDVGVFYFAPLVANAIVRVTMHGVWINIGNGLRVAAIAIVALAAIGIRLATTKAATSRAQRTGGFLLFAGLGPLGLLFLATCSVHPSPSAFLRFAPYPSAVAVVGFLVLVVARARRAE